MHHPPIQVYACMFVYVYMHIMCCSVLQCVAVCCSELDLNAPSAMHHPPIQVYACMCVYVCVRMCVDGYVCMCVYVYMRMYVLQCVVVLQCAALCCST